MPRFRPQLLGVLLAMFLLVPTAFDAPSGMLAAETMEGLDDVVAVVTGGTHTLVLRADGTVWGWGSNSDWELGVTTTAGPIGSDTPVQATGLDQVRGLATGDDHGLALRADGSVWAWGKNDHGQVGVPTENCPNHDRPCSQVPVPVPGLTGVKAVAAAKDSSFALAADGTVWAWGDNAGGQLGTGTTTDSPSPVRVDEITAVSNISAAGTRVVALLADGTVWGWGGGDSGSPTPIPVVGLSDVTAISAGYVRNVALLADGAIWTWGERDRPAPVAVPELGRVRTVVGGGLLSAAVTADGKIWMWPLPSNGSSQGQPAQVNDLDAVMTLVIGVESNVALLADGTVWTWSNQGKPHQVPAPVTLGTSAP